MTVITTFRAHPNNFGGYGRDNHPRAIVFHTPEEKPDEYESTPAWFANPAAGASTQAYADNDGDLYIMLEDWECAWACGTHSDRYDREGNFDPSNRHWKGLYKGYAPWAEPGVSNNCLTLNIEIEGFAATLDMPEAQYQAALAWTREKCMEWGIPIDLDHLVGHGDLATDRRDPGPNFPWERLLNDLKGHSEYDLPRNQEVFIEEDDVPVETRPLTQGETIAAAERVFNRFGQIIADNAGETAVEVLAGYPVPPGKRAVLFVFEA